MATSFLPLQSGDAAYESTSGAVTVTDSELYVGNGYRMAGYILRGLPVQPGSTVLVASLREVISAGSSSLDMTVRGEREPADFAATTNNLSARTKTSAGPTADGEYGVATEIALPDLSAVIQEIVNSPGYAAGDDIALFFIDRGASAASVFGLTDYEPYLFLRWALTFAFPDDYWPDNYWPEYWPDYGTAATGAAVAFMYYQRMRRRGR